MNKQDFSTAKVGDKLWSIQLGECYVKTIINHIEICCENNDRTAWVYYDLNGKHNEQDSFPSLFWSNPNIVIPEKPKRKVKKEYKVFIHIIQGLPDSVHLSLDSLISNSPLINPIMAKGILTYEIEE